MPKFREISGQFVGYIPDSIDSDIVPDRAPMNGRVTFTPVFTGGVIAFPELSPPEFAHPRTIHAKIVDGFVQVEVNEGEGDDEQIVLQPLTLMVTVDDEASQVWSWRAEFDEILIGASDEYVKIPSWSFRVPDGVGPVDLTELVPLKSSGAVDVTKGPRGAGLETITAVDGQLVFEYTDGQESTVPIPEAVQGPQGEPGPAGADGEQGPQGEKGDPGEIPDLLVGNITDATPTGKNLMLAATEGAARNALGLQTGATSIAGSLEELSNGTQTNSRVWSPRNLADYVEAKAQATVDAAKTVANVKDYGAVGDGTTDDTAAVQAALDAVYNAGGGTVIFPPATYFMNMYGVIRSHTTIEGAGATFVKKVGQGSTAVFATLGGPGYGAGAKNVTIRNLRLKGDFAAKRQIGLIGAHHVDDLLIENCVFEEAHIGGHIMDLQGCRRVTIRNCVFLGQNTVDSTNRTVECIQVDNSTRLGASVTDDTSAYDGLPCQDITVMGCRFLPVTTGGVRYPSPIPFGSHWGLEVPHVRLSFLDNVVIDPPQSDSSIYRGILHFCNSRNILIRGNVFESNRETLQSQSIFRSIPLSGVMNPEEAGTATGSTRTLPAPLHCSDVIVSENTFRGFALDSQPLIDASGSYLSTRVKNVMVIGNTFRDNSGLTGQGPLSISSYDTEGLTVSGNRFINCRNIVALGRASDVSVQGNSFSQDNFTTSSPVLVQGETPSVLVSGNLINSRAVGVWVPFNSSAVVISGNTINSVAASVGVDTTASVLITGNRVSSLGTFQSTVTATGNMIA